MWVISFPSFGFQTYSYLKPSLLLTTSSQRAKRAAKESRKKGAAPNQGGAIQQGEKNKTSRVVPIRFVSSYVCCPADTFLF